VTTKDSFNDKQNSGTEENTAGRFYYFLFEIKLFFSQLFLF
jgi:hypothetical protein